MTKAPASTLLTKEPSPAATPNNLDDPLLACLVLLTKLQHHPFSVEALRSGMPLVNGRLTPALFVRAAERAGLSAKIVSRPLSKISKLVLPAVLLLQDGQACVLVDIDQQKGKAKVLQPETDGEREIDLAELEKNYQGLSIFIGSVHRFDERSPEVLEVRSKHWFWGVIFSSWRIYRDVLLASFLISLFALVSPLFVMNVYDRIVPNNAVETLWMLAVGIGVAHIFDFIMRTLRGRFIELAGKKTDIRVSAMILEKVLGLQMAARPNSVGAFANNLSEFANIRTFITSATISALVDIPFTLLFLLVIGFLAGPIVFVPIVAIIVVITYGLFIKGALRQAVENSSRAATQKQALLIESLTGIESIKALGAESPIQKQWEQSTGYAAKWGLRSRLLSASSTNVAVFCQQVASVAIIIVGVYMIAAHTLTMGGLIAVVMLSGRTIAPMAQVSGLLASYHQALASLKTLNEVMSLPVERPAEKSFVHRPHLQGSIEFHDVSFSYPNQELESLTNVSFSIKSGEKVAIIGRMGSGKTTIEKLILGLYEPTKGAVRIDGIDVRQIDPAELRRNIGYVPQDIILFFGSVRKNITYGIPHADDKAIVRAAELAGVTEFTNRHPLGFDMPVGERGIGLSGGQRQSIAVARALLEEPPLLVMDEPSNSMDNSSEESFKARMKQLLPGKTLILVTHKASLLDLVDRIIVIEQGRMLADGPKAQVLEALRQGKLKSPRRAAA
jgi:ATP-binding cassette subfamily C protein LapB